MLVLIVTISELEHKILQLLVFIRKSGKPNSGIKTKANSLLFQTAIHY